jgi:hypothetical protein
MFNTNQQKDMAQFKQMTHQELMALTEAEKDAYRIAKKEDFYNRVVEEIRKGFTHIQLWNGCIKVRKTENGTIYSKRAGKGTGVDLIQFSELKNCTDSAMDYGWGDIKSCK